MDFQVYLFGNLYCLELDTFKNKFIVIKFNNVLI